MATKLLEGHPLDAAVPKPNEKAAQVRDIFFDVLAKVTGFAAMLAGLAIVVLAWLRLL